MSFASLGLSDPLVRAVADRNYGEPTPIQSAAIPAILRGGDMLASAATGSGKTAAFALPILQLLAEARAKNPDASRNPRALILAPTRELAAQIGDSVRAYGRHLATPVKVAVVFGGVSINPQMMALRGGADLVVATPGRLVDLVAKNALHLSNVSILVLDEADRLLDLGFAKELAALLARLPDGRQNLLFSATFPPAVQTLADALLRDPVRLTIASSPSSAPAIHQRAIEIDTDRRTPLLRHLIETHGWTSVLVFVATKYRTGHVAQKLRVAGIDAAALHGELSQGARTAALAAFKAGTLRVLIATDVAARGLDIAGLPAVVNYDLPRSATDYIHRIGRTGRAGAGGVAVNFISADTHAHFLLIEKRHALRIAREQIPGFEPVDTTPPMAPLAGGIKGHRKSKKDRLREAAARGAASSTAANRPAAPRHPPG